MHYDPPDENLNRRLNRKTPHHTLGHHNVYAAHEGEGARKRRLKQMAMAELKELRKKHGVNVGLDGRIIGTDIIAEEERAKLFDDGVVIMGPARNI